VARQNKIALTKEESLRQGRRSQQCAVETSNAKAKRPRARKSECIIPPRVPDEALNLYLRLLLKHAPLDENFVDTVFNVVSPALLARTNNGRHRLHQCELHS